MTKKNNKNKGILKNIKSTKKVETELREGYELIQCWESESQPLAHHI